VSHATLLRIRSGSAALQRETQRIARSEELCSLDCSCAYFASDGRVVPPPYVAVCKAWRELALSLPTIALRIDDRKRDAIDWWSFSCRCGDRKTLRIAELALTNCNVRSEELAGLLRAVPLRLLALQNCRSINLFGLDLPSSLRALLLCGVNGEPARALAAPHVVEATRGLLPTLTPEFAMDPKTGRPRFRLRSSVKVPGPKRGPLVDQSGKLPCGNQICRRRVYGERTENI